jgi:TonB family protein
MPLDGLTMTEGRWRAHAQRSRAALRVGPVGAALLGHALLLALAARLVIPALPGPADAGGFPLFLERIEPVGAAAIPPPSPVFDRLSPPQPMVVDSGQTATALAPVHHTGLARAHTPAAAAGAAQSASPAPEQTASARPPAAAAPDDGRTLLPGLESRIDDAVRRAAILPDAARRQRRQGRAQIRFTYRDGGVQDAQIVASSQSRLLDNAALQAVRDANYPQPPLLLRGRPLTLLVWIDFRLAPDQG